MKNLSDENLIERFAGGDNTAFDELLRRYKDSLYTYIYSLLQNREQTEDVFQDTFTKVIINIKEHRYDEKGRFIGFLFRIAHNLIIDIFREDQNTQVINSTRAGYDLFNNKELSDRSLEDQMLDTEIRNDVRRLITFLPEEQREVVMLRYYRDIPFKDIAQMKGVSINTALGWNRYAILNLRKMAKKHNIALTF